jgi:hypothetical protein
MFRPISAPPTYTLIRKKGLSLLLKEEYAEILLLQVIEDFEKYLTRHARPSLRLTGRTPHLSVSIKDEQRIVIRRYSHGGLLRAFTGDFYLFGSRAFQELALTEEIRASGISTVQPVGGVHQSVFPFFYRAYFLSLEIPQAKDLTGRLLEIGPRPSPENLIEKREMIRRVGRLVRQFHQAGFFHGDLQLKNILVAGGHPYLIDFDRSYRKKTLTLRDRIGNLLRLDRSVEKWKRRGLPVTKTDRWRFFLAYSGGDEAMRGGLERALQTHAILFFPHRCLWTVQEWIRK